MARKKKRPAPPVKAETPKQVKDDSRAMDTLKFHQSNVDREIDKMIEQLQKLGEKMIEANNDAFEEFKTTVAPDIGNMTLKELFDSGYMLDYGVTSDEKFVALGPCHYEIVDEDKPSTAVKRARPTNRATLGDSKMPSDSFATPVPNAAGAVAMGEKFITPKVIPMPKRGHVVVYTENGSPYLINLSTMRAKLPEDRPSSGVTSSATSGPVTRPTRVTRSTRATTSRQ